MKTVHVISLGCSKNLMDSERLLALLQAAGLAVSHDTPHDQVNRGDVVVINTCGFIGDAKQESINEILSWCQARRDREISGLYVMGCLSQRYCKELPEEIPEVDAWYGKTDWAVLARELGRNDHSSLQPAIPRVITTPRHYAYLKISEGCNRRCAFCAIPIITGHQVSRSMTEILDEARWLVKTGVKEINIIAQELTSYGLDLTGQRDIAPLVDSMAHIPGLEMIRLHYAYPAGFPLELLDVMARHDNVAKYMDIALQHVSDSVLERMDRHITGARTRQLLKEMRRRVPGIHIRTTLMVGFPGETERDFEELLDFVREQRFERMGAFAYCEEEGTPAAAKYKDDVPPEVKQSRLDRLMALQEEISLEIQQSKIGQSLPVIIDRREGLNYVGRTQWDSPEVDPEVIILSPSRKLATGTWHKVKITDALPYELIGTIDD